MAPKYEIMFTYDPHNNIGFRSDFKLFLRVDFLSFQKFKSSFSRHWLFWSFFSIVIWNLIFARLSFLSLLMKSAKQVKVQITKFAQIKVFSIKKKILFRQKFVIAQTFRETNFSEFDLRNFKFGESKFC